LDDRDEQGEPHPEDWADHPRAGSDLRGVNDARILDLTRISSRRIDDEHRLVYGATDDELIIIQARYHYDS
jgi:YoeB-like toxin of bacterial type II toxin-antitoxin system